MYIASFVTYAYNVKLHLIRTKVAHGLKVFSIVRQMVMFV